MSDRSLCSHQRLRPLQPGIVRVLHVVSQLTRPAVEPDVGDHAVNCRVGAGGKGRVADHCLGVGMTMNSRCASMLSAAEITRSAIRYPASVMRRSAVGFSFSQYSAGTSAASATGETPLRMKFTMFLTSLSVS